MASFAIDYMTQLQADAYKKVGVDPISWLPTDDPRSAILDQLEKLPNGSFEEAFAGISTSIDTLAIDPNATRKDKLKSLKDALRGKSISTVRESILTRLQGTGWRENEVNAQDSLEDARSSALTPYENPFDYKLVDQAMQGLKDTINLNPNYQNADGNCSRLHVGTMPTGDVNAKVIKTPLGNHYLALFNNGVFRFTYLLGKILGQALDYSDDWSSFEIPSIPVKQLVRERPHLLWRLRHLMGAYVISGHPGFSRPYTAPPGPSYVASRLAKCMVTFLVAHECAHIVHGDLDRLKPVRTTLFGNSVDQIPLDHQREYAADFVALDLMTRSKRAENEIPLLIEWAPVLLLLGLHLVRNGLEVLRTGSEQPDPESESHPTTPARLAAILRPLHESEDSQLIHMRKRADWLIELFALLWQDLRKSFEEGHQLLVAPSPIWLASDQAKSRSPAVSVYADSSRQGSIPCHKLQDGSQALAVGDYIWLMGDRHAATAAWRCAVDLGQETAEQRLIRSEGFDSALNDEVVFS